MPRPITGIPAGGISSRMRRLLGIRGDDPLRESDDVLVPVLDVVPSPLHRAEEMFPGGEFLAWSGLVTLAAGGAGQRSCHGLFNPGGTNIVATVELILAEDGTQPELRLMPSTTGWTDRNASYPRDSRISPTAFVPPAVNLRGGPIHTFTRNNVALQAGEDFMAPLNGAYQLPVVLGPGAGVFICPAVDAQALARTAFGWRWRIEK